MALEKFIDDFGELPTWKKILLFFPLIMVAVALFFVRQQPGNNADEFIKWNKKKTDKKVKDFHDELKESEKEIDRIEIERERIKREIQNDKKDYASDMDRIDNADGDELLRIAEEIRSRIRGDRDK